MKETILLFGLAVVLGASSLVENNQYRAETQEENTYYEYSASNFSSVPEDWVKYEYGATASTSAKAVDNRLVITTSAGAAQSYTQHFGGVYLIDADHDYEDFTMEMKFSIDSVYEGAWRWLGVIFHAQEVSGVSQLYDSETGTYTPVEPAVNTMSGYTLVARASKGQIFQSSINGERKTNNGPAVATPTLYDGNPLVDHTITIQVKGNIAKYYIDGVKYVEFDTTTQDGNLGSHYSSGKIAIITSTIKLNIKSLYLTSQVRDDVSKDNPTISFTANGKSFENGTHLKENDLPEIQVSFDCYVPEYKIYYTKDDGATDLGTTAPTTPGTYAINVIVYEHAYNAQVFGFRWYVIDEVNEKITPTIEFENSEFEYDHLSHTPSVIFKVNDEVVYDVQFEFHFDQNGVITHTAPSGIGYYSYVINVIPDEKYNAIGTYKVFNIYDSANAFTRDWATLREEGGSEGICGYLNPNTRGKLDTLLSRYEALSNKEKLVVDSTIDVEGVTIGQTIAYVKSLLEKIENNQISPTINNIATKDSYIVLCIVMISTIIAVATYSIVNRKKII